MVNLVLLALVACFALWEVLAGFYVSGPFAAMNTLSEYVWSFEARVGVPDQALVGLACVALFMHLVLRWPLGPS